MNTWIKDLSITININMSAKIIGYKFLVKDEYGRWKYLKKPNGYLVTIGTTRGETGAIFGLQKRSKQLYSQYSLDRENIVPEYDEDATRYHQERRAKQENQLKEYEEEIRQKMVDDLWPKCPECNKQTHLGYCPNCNDT